MRYLFVVLFVLLSCLPAFAQGWEWLSPLPQGNTLTDLDVLGQDHLYSTGYQGTSIGSTNGGQDWALRNSGAYASPAETEFISTTEGWGITSHYSSIQVDSLQNAIMHTTDGGLTWHHQYHDAHVQLYGIAWPAPQLGWVVGVLDSTYQLVILHTTNGGITWTAQVHDSVTQNAHIYFLNAQRGWIALENLTLRTTDGGATWQQYATPYWMYFDLLFEDSLRGWGTSFYDLYRTTNAGQQWTPQTLPLVGNEWPKSVAVGDVNHIHVATGSGAVISSTNGGMTWTRRVISTSSLEKIVFSGVQHGWICGGGGKVYETTDAGTTWTLRAGYSALVDSFYYSEVVAFANPQNGWIAGMNPAYQAEILHTTDGGTDWTLQYLDTAYSSFSDIEAVSATDIWAVGTYVLHTTDGGQQWNLVNVAEDVASYNKIVCLSDQLIWLISGYDFQMLVHRTTDGGATWTSHEVQEACKYSDMAAGDANNVWVTSWTDLDYCSITHSSDGGETWQEQADTLSISSAVFFLDALHGWASSYTGFLRTSDGGATWTQGGLEGYWGVSKIHFFDLENGWVVAYNDVLRTTDGGTNWQRFTPAVEYSLSDAAFIDMDHGWACGWYNYLLRFDAATVSVPKRPVAPPEKFVLYPAYPNPFNPSTTLSFELSRPARTQIDIFDITGRLVQRLSDHVYSAGRHTLTFDASSLPSGLYFARASSGSWHSVQKLVLLK